MKIRIVKAKSDVYWYAGKIGEVFNVVDDISQSYRVRIEGGYRFVSKADVEEVIEHNSQLYRKVDRPVREGDTVLITDAYMAYGMYKNGDVIRCDGLKNSFRGGIYSKEISNPNGNAVGLVTKDEFVVIEPIEQPSLNAPSYAEVSELLHEASRQTRIDNAFDKVVARNGAALKRLADSDKEDIVNHNGKQYRKVKRKAAVGEFDLIIIEQTEVDGYEVGDVFVAEKVYDLTVQITDKDGDINHVEHYEYSVLELVEQSGQSETLTERDLLANLAQEVAELKRELHRLKGAVIDNETDIADLEDRVDENEKDMEELIGRINDVSEAVVPVEVIEKVIAEFRELEGHAEKLCDHYEDNGIKELAQFHDGKSHAFLDAQKLLKEALRNG